MRVVIASRNRGKIAEIREFLADIEGLELVEMDAVCPGLELTEEGASFSENAVSKALKAAKVTGLVALADDSGLEVDALGGGPGVLSARFALAADSDAPRSGDSRVNVDSGASPDDANNRKLLQLLRRVAPGERTARFRCVVAVATPEGDVRIAEGVCEGHISLEPRGSAGFGYDPLFIPEGYDSTFGELGERVKGLISHRARAMGRAREILLQLAKDGPP